MKKYVASILVGSLALLTLAAAAQAQSNSECLARYHDSDVPSVTQLHLCQLDIN
jgi:hypothetical protein